MTFTLSKISTSPYHPSSSNDNGEDMSAAIATLGSINVDPDESVPDVTITMNETVASVQSWLKFNADGSFTTALPLDGFILGSFLGGEGQRGFVQVDGKSASEALADKYIEKVVKALYGPEADVSKLKYFAGLSKTKLQADFRGLDLFAQVIPNNGTDYALDKACPQIVYQLVQYGVSCEPGADLPLSVGWSIDFRLHITDVTTPSDPAPSAASAAAHALVDVNVRVRIMLV